MRKVIFHCCILFFISISAFAQYGSGVDGSIADGSGTTFTDNVRTHLTANASAGQAVITVNDASTFTNGDLCLVIQMLGTGVGKYEERTISSKTATTITFTTTLTYAYNANGTTNLAQVIRIPQYLNVTLKTAGDIITCNAWDGLTGGVCYFKVSGTIDGDSDGQINVDGKGYRGGAGGTGILGTTGGCAGLRGTTGNAGSRGSGGASGGVSSTCTGGLLGNGGAGGNAIGTADGGAGGGQDYSIGAPSVTYGNQGGTGEGSGGGFYDGGTQLYVPATNNSISNNIGITSGTDLLMGGGGAGGRQGSASSGGGGGGGGAGGSAGNGNSGNPGITGNGGSVGGVGGVGGGILFVRVNTLIGSCLIQANGANGSDGIAGSSGTAGGSGGNRGTSGNAGSGGGGDGGLGGRGSCPGHGGAGGLLLVLGGSEEFFTGSYISIGGSRGSHSAGGTGGVGGDGGASATAGVGGDGGQGGYSSDGCTGSAGTTVSAGTSGGSGGAGAPAAIVGICATGVIDNESYCNSVSGGAGVILPIELLSFTGFAKKEVNVLRWVTLTETNNDYFTLYRSEDAESWHKISIIDGAGTSSTQHMYEFIDELPVYDRVNYYQLQQTDFDGKSTKSIIIAIVPKGKTSIYVGEDEINVIIAEASTINYEIIGVSGSKVVSASKLQMQQGILKINISDLAASVYLLRIQVGQRVESIKFFKR